MIEEFLTLYRSSWTLIPRIVIRIRAYRDGGIAQVMVVLIMSANDQYTYM